jgi:hypothetical protein
MLFHLDENSAGSLAGGEGGGVWRGGETPTDYPRLR